VRREVEGKRRRGTLYYHEEDREDDEKYRKGAGLSYIGKK